MPSPPSFSTELDNNHHLTVNDYLTELEPENLIDIVAKAFFMATCDRLGIVDIENIQL